MFLALYHAHTEKDDEKKKKKKKERKATVTIVYSLFTLKKKKKKTFVVKYFSIVHDEYLKLYEHRPSKLLSFHLLPLLPVLQTPEQLIDTTTMSVLL